MRPLSDGTYLACRIGDGGVRPDRVERHGLPFSVHTAAGAVVARGVLFRGAIRTTAGALTSEAAGIVADVGKGTCHALKG